MALTDEDKQWILGNFKTLKVGLEDELKTGFDTVNERFDGVKVGFREHFDERMNHLETRLLRAFAEAKIILLEGILPK